ncbi:MAG: radical SAM protein [Oligoflexia bacterium]|nr:radical SAM protein [Oligoflexia bacterium]
MYMQDEYKIDSHKLIYHPQRVGEWLSACGEWQKEKNIFPIYLEVSPISYCNHRCIFCALDFVNQAESETCTSKTSQIDFKVLSSAVDEWAILGIKSIMFAGEGEPALYPKLPQILDLCTTKKIDTSLTTNFVPVNKNRIENFVKNCKWIKISVAAGDAKTYAKLQGTTEKDFYLLIENIKYALEFKNANKYKCSIGMQIILLPENIKSVIDLARIASKLEVDYLVVKPYSQHPLSKNCEYKNINYQDKIYFELYQDLQKYSNEKFKVIYRYETIKRYNANNENYNNTNFTKRYKTCLSVPFFWSYISSSGDVLGCSNWFNDQKFCYGNINENSFAEIWQADRRRESIEYIKTKLNVENCRQNCRMDNINLYLWELQNPHEHVNFI